MAFFALLLGACSFFTSEDTYTITWKNHDGEVLETDTKVAGGVMPTYDGETPTKANSDTHTYTFIGWSPEVEVVSKNQIYIAEFEATPRNSYIKLETPIINETLQEVIANQKITWNKVEGALGYKVIVDGVEHLLDEDTLEYDFSYNVYYIKIQAIGDSNHIDSEIKELTLMVTENGINYLYFGRYPQTVVSNTSIITELNKLTKTNSNGYYEHEGYEYAKLAANPSSSSYVFSNNQTIVKNQVYYFKVEPIKWRVLEQEDGTLTLLTDMILDQEQFYTSSSNRNIDGETIYANNYEHSTIRNFLNNTFYSKAFNNVPKSIILTSFIDNSASTTANNPNSYVSNNTNNKVYLLSYQETVNKYFSNNNDRRAIASDYARARYVYVSGNYGFWWLRSPINHSSNRASSVAYDGNLSDSDVSIAFIGVRPAIRIKID